MQVWIPFQSVRPLLMAPFLGGLRGRPKGNPVLVFRGKPMLVDSAADQTPGDAAQGYRGRRAQGPQSGPGGSRGPGLREMSPF